MINWQNDKIIEKQKLVPGFDVTQYLLNKHDIQSNRFERDQHLLNNKYDMPQLITLKAIVQLSLYEHPVTDNGRKECLN